MPPYKFVYFNVSKFVVIMEWRQNAKSFALRGPIQNIACYAATFYLYDNTQNMVLPTSKAISISINPYSTNK